jgi:glycosyltransferase involved in cell wall biosynthesis
VGAGGVAEVVRDGEAGLLVGAEAGRLAAAIGRMLEDDVLRQRCAAAGRAAARAYAIDEVVQRLVALYRHVRTDLPTIAAPE